MSGEKSSFFRLCLALLSVFMLCVGLQAEEKSGTTLYIGLAASSSQVRGGDFDGLHFVTNEAIWISVPQLGSGVASGIVLGGRGRWIGIEFGLLQSGHSGSFLDPREDAQGPINRTFGRNIYWLDFTASKKIMKSIEAFVIFGAWGSNLKVKGNLFVGDAYLVGAYDIRWRYYQRGDASIYGTGLNLGVGLNIPIVKSLFLSPSLVFRFNKYDSAGGEFSDLYTNQQIDQVYKFDSMKSSELALLVYLTYRFHIDF